MTVSSPEPIPPPRAFDRVLNFIACGFGTGYFPRIPGTVGSLLGPPLVWFVQTTGNCPWITLAVGVLAFFLGLPICNAGIRVLQLKDPAPVVYDEIVAFFWVFLFVPVTWETALAGFLLFRIFDVAKPWPIRRFERLPGAWGIMTDDTVAGLIVGVLLGVGWWLIG